jgi:hypothetical protein
LRFKRIGNKDDWKRMRVNEVATGKSVRRRTGLGMFPTAHDIVDLEDINGKNVKDACLAVLQKHRDVGNKILVTTKPRLTVIKAIDKLFRKHKHLIDFRFTVGSNDNERLKFWEPNAPSFDERLKSLKYAHRKGYGTSISIEPFLDPNPKPLIEVLRAYVTGEIWVGCMNYIPRTGIDPQDQPYYDEIRRYYEPDQLRALYVDLIRDEQIRIKDSFRSRIYQEDRDCEFQALPVKSVKLGKQVRSKVDAQTRSFEALKESLRKGKLVHPIVVTRSGDDDFELVVGSRRLEAYRKLGRTRIPAIIERSAGSEEEIIAGQLAENLMREELNPVDEAEAYEAFLKTALGVSSLRDCKAAVCTFVRPRRRASLGKKPVEQIEKLVAASGKSPATIWRHLNILELRDKNGCLEAVANQSIGLSQAYALAKRRGDPRFSKALRMAVGGCTAKSLQLFFKGTKQRKDVRYEHRITRIITGLEKMRERGKLPGPVSLAAICAETERLLEMLKELLPSRARSDP